MKNSLHRHIPILSLLLLLPVCSLAADIENSQEQSTIVANSTVKSTVNGTAKDWGLTESEWAQYQKLMQGPSGLWYGQLSPSAVLGMNTGNPEDERHFAEIYARQEHQKVEHELAFNKAAFDAMKRLYPNEPMIKPFDITPFNPTASNSK